MRTLLRFSLALAFALVFVAWIPFLFLSSIFGLIDEGFEKLLDVIEEVEEIVS